MVSDFCVQVKDQMFIVEKARAKLSGWKANSLSQAWQTGAYTVRSSSYPGASHLFAMDGFPHQLFHVVLDCAYQ